MADPVDDNLRCEIAEIPPYARELVRMTIRARAVRRGKYQ
jgi:hypothetical protein